MFAMQKKLRDTLKIILIPALMLGMCAQLIGCASGGFKLTRKYARFVNSQNIILRIVLYILTGVVFAVTLLIDAVIFNTMDFWNGRVSANDYHFEKDGKHYAVKHYYKGEKNLRNTEIRIYSAEAYSVGRVEKTIQLSETSNGEVQFIEDGVLKKTFDGIHQIQMNDVSKNNEAKYLPNFG